MKNPKISIIILNWNGLNDTIECLSSVMKLDYPNFEVVVVDNGSTDNSVEVIKKRFSEVTLIATGKNLGFAEGNNVGIRYAINNTAEFILLLNNDTIVDFKLIDALLDAAKRHLDDGIFGARLLHMHSPDTVQFAGALWDNKEVRFRYVGEGEREENVPGEENETNYVCGAALFFRAEVARKIGLLDSRFFLSWEETDWCFRARKAGYGCRMVPAARVWHKIAASFDGEKSPLRSYFISRNRLLWAEKNLPMRGQIRVWCGTLKRITPDFYVGKADGNSFVKRLWWGCLEFAKECRKYFHNPRQRSIRLGVRDYVLRRFGNCPEVVWKLNKLGY